jgi:hypothetical protein
MLTTEFVKLVPNCPRSIQVSIESLSISIISLIRNKACVLQEYHPNCAFEILDKQDELLQLGTAAIEALHGMKRIALGLHVHDGTVEEWKDKFKKRIEVYQSLAKEISTLQDMHKGQ